MHRFEQYIVSFNKPTFPSIFSDFHAITTFPNWSVRLRHPPIGSAIQLHPRKTSCSVPNRLPLSVLLHAIVHTAVSRLSSIIFNSISIILSLSSSRSLWLLARRLCVRKRVRVFVNVVGRLDNFHFDCKNTPHNCFQEPTPQKNQQ